MSADTIVRLVTGLPTFDLRLVSSFAVLGEQLHFGRAARRLSMSQPALSRQIARLEAQLPMRDIVTSQDRRATHRAKR